MFSADTLGALLHSLATGNPGRVENLILTSEELTEDERRLLWDRWDTSATPAAQARSLGDAIRSGGHWDFLANECYRAAFYLGDGLADLREDPLFGYFSSKRSGRVLDKWIHYLPIYSRHFAPFRGRPLRMLEIGVYRGGSLDMWNWYFGRDAVIVGVDIDEGARTASDPRNPIEIGDQSDPEFLAAVERKHGPFDIVLDDGGHEMRQQIVTIETLFPKLVDGGVFLVEDTHTSYWDRWGGGRGRDGTFVEWSKNRIDDVNGYHQPGAVDRLWTDHVDGVHFYDSVVVIDKKARFAPFAEQVGHSEFLNYPRSSAQFVTEMLATRDAALADRDRLLAQQSRVDAEAMEEEIRRLRGEIKSLRPQAAAMGDRLRKVRIELDEARAAVRGFRQKADGRPSSGA